MKNKLYLLLIVLLAVTGTQCSKEGPTGPQGAQGTQGPQGLQGAAGPAGVPGSRVISYVVTRASAMIWNASHIIDIGNSVLPIPPDIKENGIILTYIVIRGTLTSDTWHPIPGHIFTATPAVTYYFVNASALTNVLRISAYNEDGTDLPAGTNPPNPNKLRVVLIPADQVNNIARKASPPDLGDYEAVKAAFNIREEDAIEVR